MKMTAEKESLYIKTWIAGNDSTRSRKERLQRGVSGPKS